MRGSQRVWVLGRGRETRAGRSPGAQLALRTTPSPAAADVVAPVVPGPAEPELFDEPAADETTGTSDTAEPGIAAPTAVPDEPALDLPLPEPAPAPSSMPDPAVSAEAAVAGLHAAGSVLPVEPEPAATEDAALPVAAEPPAEKRRGWWKR